MIRSKMFEHNCTKRKGSCMQELLRKQQRQHPSVKVRKNTDKLQCSGCENKAESMSQSVVGSNLHLRPRAPSQGPLCSKLTINTQRLGLREYNGQSKFKMRGNESAMINQTKIRNLIQKQYQDQNQQIQSQPLVEKTGRSKQIKDSDKGFFKISDIPHPIKVGSSFRLGNSLFTIEKICLSSQTNGEIAEQISCKSSRVYQAQQKRQVNQNRQELACRFCLMGQRELQIENEKGIKIDSILIKPCKCKGSCESVHIGCLKEWAKSKVVRKVSKSVHLYNHESQKCQLCKTQIPFHFKVKSRCLQAELSQRPLSLISSNLISYRNSSQIATDISLLERKKQSFNLFTTHVDLFDFNFTSETFGKQLDGVVWLTLQSNQNSEITIEGQPSLYRVKMQFEKTQQEYIWKAIGRDSKCELPLTSSDILSRKHAFLALDKQSQRLLIKDNNSKNGTYATND